MKNWVDGITTRREKNAITSKMYILRRSAQVPLMITLYNFALKVETSWAKKVIKPIILALYNYPYNCQLCIFV